MREYFCEHLSFGPRRWGGVALGRDQGGRRARRDTWTVRSVPVFVGPGWPEAARLRWMRRAPEERSPAQQAVLAGLA